MNENIHTFETLDGGTVVFTFRNAMLGDVRFRMFNRYASEEEWPDFNLRSDFAWMLGYLVDVEGLDGLDIPPNADLDTFNAAYYAFMELVNVETFYDCVRAVNAMKERSNPLEKPDSALTAEDKADPN